MPGPWDHPAVPALCLEQRGCGCCGHSVGMAVCVLRLQPTEVSLQIAAHHRSVLQGFGLCPLLRSRLAASFLPSFLGNPKDFAFLGTLPALRWHRGSNQQWGFCFPL